MLTFETRDLYYKAKTNPVKGKKEEEEENSTTKKNIKGWNLKKKKNKKDPKQNKQQKTNGDQIQHKNKLKLNVDRWN